MLARLRERMLEHRRLRCRFTKLFDQHYLEELRGDELEVALEDCFFRLERLPDGTAILEEEHLLRFLEQEVTIPFTEGRLFYKVFAVENFSDGQSVLVFKCHHALADGMSLIGLLTSLQD